MNTLPFLLLATLALCPMACEEAPARPEPALLGRDASTTDVVGEWMVDPADHENAAHNQLLNRISRGEIDATEADIPRLLPQALEVIRQNPMPYTLRDDGTFVATSHNMTVTGTWTLSGDTLIITSPEHNMTRRFRVADRRLENISELPNAKPVALIPR